MLSSKAVENMAINANVPKNDVLLVMQALADLLKETVHGKGEAVSVKNLGTFKANKTSSVISLIPLFNNDDDEEETGV